MANRDRVVSYQDVFYNQSDDSLSLSDTQRTSSAAQTLKEPSKILRQPQKDCPIISLVGDCLQLSMKRLFTLA
jgi:hypothetical protein